MEFCRGDVSIKIYLSEKSAPILTTSVVSLSHELLESYYEYSSIEAGSVVLGGSSNADCPRISVHALEGSVEFEDTGAMFNFVFVLADSSSLLDCADIVRSVAMQESLVVYIVDSPVAGVLDFRHGEKVIFASGKNYIVSATHLIRELSSLILMPSVISADIEDLRAMPFCCGQAVYFEIYDELNGWEWPESIVSSSDISKAGGVVVIVRVNERYNDKIYSLSILLDRINGFVKDNVVIYYLDSSFCKMLPSAIVTLVW